MITEGDPETPQTLDTIKVKGALLICSYEEVVQAMLEATEWISQNCIGEESILLCINSQSLCIALENHNPETGNPP